MNLNLSEFGYYVAHYGNGLTYYSRSKLEALEIAQRLNGYITWHFNDEIFSLYDWTKEIDESIRSLYRRRAEQLRKKYDRIVLMYSGGFDSHNMLMAFLENGLKVDALGSLDCSLDTTPDSVLNIEWQIQTQPKINKILEKYPGMDVFRLDFSNENLSSSLDATELYSINNGMFAPSMSCFNHLKNLLPLQYQKGTTCMLYGIDKPRLRYHNGKFIYNFIDVGTMVKPITEDSGIEYFYWTPELPELVIKQAQIVKRFWEQNKELMFTHSKNIQRPNIGLVLDQAHDTVQRLVYPHCEVGIYRSWPPPESAGPFARRDQWIYRANTNHKEVFFDTYKAFYFKLDKKFFTGGNRMNKLIGSISKDYVL